MVFVCEQNSRLLVDARSARTYRDELDALRERAMKADKLESEVARYREQLHKMELYKAKVEVGLIQRLCLICLYTVCCGFKIQLLVSDKNNKLMSAWL